MPFNKGASTKSPLSADLRKLEAAASRGELLVMAGAGISKLAPSYLPDWFSFNRSLLEQAKASALCVLHLSPEALAALEALDIKQIPVEAFSDLIVRSLASEGYFSILNALDADRSNANHTALSALAQRGVLRTIVTTNFDTLIERAFRDAGEALCIVTPRDIKSPIDETATTTLYKIHGSAHAPETLIDTVSQKRRGLPAPMRELLSNLYRTRHVLVLGYSGADLRLDENYLGFSAIDANSPGITWVVHPGSTPSDPVQALKGRVGDSMTIVSAELPDVFRRLGEPAGAPAETDPDARLEAEHRAVARIRRFFEQPYIGPLSSAAFCTNLLVRLGNRDAASALRRALAAEAERWGARVPSTAATVFRAIGSGALADGDLTSAERWARMELAFWNVVDAHLPTETPSEARAELQRNTAAALMNLSVVQRALGRLPEARATLGSAIELANKAAHDGLLALVLEETAILAWQLEENQDDVIELYRRSISAAVEDGGVNQQARSRIELAEVLVRIGEYDLAWHETEQAVKQMPFAVSRDAREQIEIVRATIDGRRGSTSGAMTRLQPQLLEHPAATRKGARVRAALARAIGYREPMRVTALAILDEVLDAMNAELLPQRGLSEVPDPQRLQQLRAAVAQGGSAAITALIQVPGRVDEEAWLRGQVVLAELTRFESVIPPLFEQLCQMKRGEGRWLRVMDLALGLFPAAKRALDAQRVLAAINLYNVARAVGGVVGFPVLELESALATATPGTQRDAIAHNLAILRAGTDGQLGDVLLTPEVGTPLPEPYAQIWDEALSQDNLVDAVVFPLEAREHQQA